MGNNSTSSQNNNINNNNLAQLTSNPDFQNVLMGVYRNNDQFPANQMYYNFPNGINQSFEGPIQPIKIKKTYPEKVKLSFQKKTLELVIIKF